MARVSSAISGPVPAGLRIAFVVLTLVAVGVAVLAGFRGIWFVTVICGLFALLNLGVLWATRTPRSSARSGSARLARRTGRPRRCRRTAITPTRLPATP